MYYATKSSYNNNKKALYDNFLIKKVHEIFKQKSKL